MEEYFYVLYFALYALILVLAIFLLVTIFKEYKLYRMCSDEDGIRVQMASDPKRLHFSLIYLMTYLTRSDDNADQRDKLDLIVRYIREVIPPEFQLEAITLLKEFTDREMSVGKKTKRESLIDVYAFKSGGSCVMKGQDSFHFKRDIYGKEMAEELSRFVTEDDRMYIMYMLFRLAMADNHITEDGRKSEVKMLESLCVEGLKINRDVFEYLMTEFTSGNAQRWYEQHFGNKGNRYPAADLMANIFSANVNTFASFDAKISKKTSKLSLLNVIFIVASVIVFGTLYYVNDRYAKHLMSAELSDGNLSFWFTLVVCIAIPLISYYLIREPESLDVPILRTKSDNRLQLRGIIVSVLLSVVVIGLLFWYVSNVLYLVGNDTFCNDGIIVKTAQVNGKRADTKVRYRDGRRREYTDYYLEISKVSLADSDFENCKRKCVSERNKLCLETLPMFSGMQMESVKNDKSMSVIEVSNSTFNRHEKGSELKLKFRMGYFGVAYYDGFEK